jgi:steroid 5-alpha reductase family enzyme
VPDSKTPPIGRSLAGLAIALAIAAVASAAGSHHGMALGSLPAFSVLALLAFGIQWLAFIPAYLAQSERYYDLVGSITYISTAGLALTVKTDPRSLLLFTLIAVWALRLGSFLFLRIRADGRDLRFDRIKPFFFRFLMTWTLQGLWVLITAGAAFAAMTGSGQTGSGQAGLDTFAVAGTGLWLLGFAIEAVADAQKRRFRRDPANAGRFITSGLWAWSRHPNYFGEILLWIGIAVIAFPALEGWQHLTLVSPLFVYLLLTRVSGVPALERIAEKRWGDDADFRDYRTSTPALFPRPTGSRSP